MSDHDEIYMLAEEVVEEEKAGVFFSSDPYNLPYIDDMPEVMEEVEDLEAYGTVTREEFRASVRVGLRRALERMNPEA